MFGNQSHRGVGVKIPDGQLHDRSDAPDLTVLDLAPLELRAGRYVERGKIKMGLFAKVGDVWHLTPDGDNWLQRCRQTSAALTKNLKEAEGKFKGVSAEDVPTTDAVDIIASANHGATSSA